jgi:tetratricopeptide (TPR) repeat protein
VLRRSLASPIAVAALLVVAAACWSVVLVKQSRSAPFFRHLEAGRQYASRGEARLAASEWQAALALDSNNPTALELLAELFSSTGNWQGGALVYERLAKAKPDLPETHSRTAICLFRSGNEKKALSEAQEELKRNPDDQAALIISALVLSKMSELDKEAVCLERILKKDPDNLFVLIMLAENLTYSHSYTAARPYVERILMLDPGNAEAYSLRGIATFNEDRSPDGLKRAEADFIQSLKRDPLAPFPRLYLGKIYRERGDLQRSIFQLSTAQHFIPNKMDINFELANSYELAGQHDKAAICRKKFVEVRDRMSLESSLQKRCSVDPTNFENHLQMGTMLMNEGDYSLARPYLEQAKSLRPSDARVTRALQQLATRTEGSVDPRDALQSRLRSLGAGAPPSGLRASSGSVGRQ